MAKGRLQMYKVEGQDGDGLVLWKWENDFYSIYRLMGKTPIEENTFSSVEEVELVLGVKLSFVGDKEVEIDK